MRVIAGRCPTCGHVLAIHSADGTCPRWAAVRGLDPGTRVCVRMARRWPDAEGHTMAYFADCVDAESGMVLVWDLTADRQFEAPIKTVQRESGWTRAPTTREKQDAQDELTVRLGSKVSVLRNLS